MQQKTQQALQTYKQKISAQDQTINRQAQEIVQLKQQLTATEKENCQLKKEVEGMTRAKRNFNFLSKGARHRPGEGSSLIGSYKNN